ncbi:MAG: ribonuclease P protein component [Variovorax sp.]
MDDSPAVAAVAAPVSVGAHWLGVVLPKRLARRSVTRNLLRRQIRAAVLRHQAALPPGLWVVRLRAPFAPTEFISAASLPLRRAARDELDALMRDACAAAPRGARFGRSPGRRSRPGASTA